MSSPLRPIINGLRKYGDYKEQIGLEKNPDEYIAKILEITAEIKRVLKPTGQFWLNMGDSYGGSGMGVSYAGKTCGPNSILKGKLERFPGVGHSRGKMDKCLLMIPERIALKMIDEQKWVLRNKIKWAKQILNFKEKRTYGSTLPTSTKDRFNESGEELYFFVKNKKYYSNLDAVKLPIQTIENREMGIIRQKNYSESKYNKFGYKPNTSETENDFTINKGDVNKLKQYQGKFAGNQNAEMFNSPRARTQRKGYQAKNQLNNDNKKNLPSIWLIQTEPHNFQNELNVNVDHFATFPQALVEIPIKFGCPPNGIVLDPFMGSGTTAIVAKKLGRNYMGIELNPDYIAIANKRISIIPNSLNLDTKPVDNLD